MGSGKSSLVFDVLFEAGRKSYLQSIGVLSSLGEDNGYDSISGLRPTVAIKQGIVRQSNPRSVVGTRTRLLHYLGTLYANEHNRRRGTTEVLTASHFSFNSPLGMCLDCEGRGYTHSFDFSVLLPNKKTTLPEMYAHANCATAFKHMLKHLPERHGIDLATPFLQLPGTIRNLVLYGQNPDGARRVGLDTQLKARLNRGKDIGNTLMVGVCESCSGSRISAEAMAVRLHGKHIGNLANMTISELYALLVRSGKKRGATMASRKNSTAASVDKLLRRRILQLLEQLMAVKLDYLTLYRSIPTLSGGEIQRLFLMSYLTSDMESLIYIFDEPTSGLHESEKQELLKKLSRLKEQGNSLIIVEHDPQTIAAAEQVIEIGAACWFPRWGVSLPGQLQRDAAEQTIPYKVRIYRGANQ